MTWYLGDSTILKIAMQCLHLSLDNTMDLRTGFQRPLLALHPKSPMTLLNHKRVSLCGPCDVSGSYFSS